MGTSSSGSGAGGGNPLIPAWIPSGDLPANPPPESPNPNEEENANNQDVPNPDNEDGPNSPADAQPGNDTGPEVPAIPSGRGIPNRFTKPRSDFNKYLRSRGSDTDSLKSALRGYSKHAAGGSTKLARRMAPSSSRVASFYGAINTFKDAGSREALKRFHLESYIDRPIVDTLSALCDEIFKDTGSEFENTQDDSITKQAYTNTIVRISEIEGIDLNQLTNENIELMTAIFIEETIVQRVICDIGNDMTEFKNTVQELVDMENNVYQIVNGLVRTKIMPEIIATQLGEKKDIEKKMENIYRIAFDSMANLTD